jgi:hypothetical protein
MLKIHSNTKPQTDRLGIRYTTNNWNSFADEDGQKLSDDLFSVIVKINTCDFRDGFVLHYAIYKGLNLDVDNIQSPWDTACKIGYENQLVWDDNNHKNYTVNSKNIQTTDETTNDFDWKPYNYKSTDDVDYIPNYIPSSTNTVQITDTRGNCQIF